MLKQQQCVINVSDCSLDSSNFNFSESFFEQEKEEICISDGLDESSGEFLPRITEQRRKDARNVLIMHLNVNNLQNKFEEVRSLMKDFKAQVVYLTETKIDASYPNSQFMVDW